MADDWSPPAPDAPMPVEVIATGTPPWPPGEDHGWFPPSRQHPLPVEIVDGAGGAVAVVPEAPDALALYGRYGPPTGQWAPITVGGGGITDAPTDGGLYGRQSGVWTRAVALAGDTMTGQLILPGSPTNSLGAATKADVDAVGATANAAVRRAGDTMTGALVVNAVITAGGLGVRYAGLPSGGGNVVGFVWDGAAVNIYVDGNLNGQIARTDRYLPLVGGTLTGALTVNAVVNANRDLVLGRTDQSTAYITRPNSAGFKNLAFGVGGGGPLDSCLINSVQTTITGGVSSTGAGAGFPFDDRTNPGAAQAWILYAHDGAAWLWRGDDKVGFGAGGNISLPTGNGIQYRFGGVNNVGFGWVGGVLHAFVDATDLGVLQISASDARLKRNIAPVERDAVAAINAIELHAFDRLNPVDRAAPAVRHEIGYTAQQLRRVIPEAVAGADDDPERPASLDLLPLVAYAHRAIQQLDARLAAAERQVAELTGRLAAAGPPPIAPAP